MNLLPSFILYARHVDGMVYLGGLLQLEVVSHLLDALLHLKWRESFKLLWCAMNSIYRVNNYRYTQSSS